MIILDRGVSSGWFPVTEYEKAKVVSKLDRVYNYDSTRKVSEFIVSYLKEQKIDKVFVDHTFPYSIAKEIIESNIQISIDKENSILSQREIKNQNEIDFIRDASSSNVKIMDGIRSIIAESTVENDGRLKYDSEFLTSEYLQNYVLKKSIDFGLYSETCIVAQGNQACNPHENGYGFIRSNLPIVVDIFPRSRTSYYFSDMTRTFCKGRATDDMRKIYSDVLEVQKRITGMVSNSVDGNILYNFNVDFFKNKGYKSGVIDGVLQGFNHGTGHGVGLECHEAPYISRKESILRSNSLVTVEPGLYYIDIGACRIEDLVLVTKDGCEVLTSYEKVLEVD